MSQKLPKIKVLTTFILFFVFSIVLSPNAALAAVPSDNKDVTFQSSSDDFAHIQVNAIAVQGNGKILIGGDFTSYNGTPRKYIARLLANGNIDTTFNNVGTGLNSDVTAIIIQSDGKILVGGYFTSYNGTARGSVARLNDDGSLDTSFDPGAASNSSVNILALQGNGQVLVGGSFINFAGSGRNGIVRLNSNGTVDTGFNAGLSTSSDVRTIAVQTDGQILFGGWDSNGIRRVNPDGTLDGSFSVGSNFDNAVFSIVIQPDDQILVGGWFSSYNGTSRGNIIRLNTNGTVDTSFDPGAGANYRTQQVVVQPDGKIIIGGYFWEFDGASVFSLARMNADGSADTSFNSGIPDGDWVYALAMWNQLGETNNRLLIGGNFYSYNGNPENSFLRVYNSGYQIANLISEADAVNPEGSIKVGSTIGSVRPDEPVTLKIDGLPLAYTAVDFSVNEDRDWTLVDGGVDIPTSRSFIENLNPTDAPGASVSHNLYIPKLSGQQGVHICPNAVMMDDVTADCTGGYSLSEGAVNLAVANIDGQDYWVVSGLTGTGGLGLSQNGVGLTVTPSISAISTTQEVVLTYVASFGFVANDKVQFHFEPGTGFALAVCGTPTDDANGDLTTDGSGASIESSPGNFDIFEYTFSNTISSGSLSFCVSVTSPGTGGSYSIRVTDDNGSFGNALYYVGGDNNVFVTASVPPTLSFNLRNLDDTADLDANACAFGVTSTSAPIPNYDNVDDGISECGYSLAIGTNSGTGFQVQIEADDDLNSSSSTMINLGDGGTFSAGVEAYGLANITPAASGRNVTTGLYTETMSRNGSFNLVPNTGTFIPLVATNFVSYSGGIEYSAGTRTDDITQVMHGLVISSGTPAGYYDQVLKYTVTANF
jgi:uncharacterized delta-60 repeat protein